MNGKKQFNVIGAGLSGSVASRILAEKGHLVTIFEKERELGGNLVEDIIDGTIVHRHGPHIFHTNYKEVWKWLNKYTTFEPYFHKVNGYIDGQLVPIPFNFRSIELIFGKKKSEVLIHTLLDNFKFGSKVSIFDLLNHSQPDVVSFGEYIFEKVFKGYSEKQWGCDINDIDLSVIKRVPVNLSYDDRYFDDVYQGIPKKGYSDMINSILNHPNIELVNQNVLFSDFKKQDNMNIVCSGAIDEFFGLKYGKLDYRSLKFQRICLDSSNIPVSTVQTNFPNNFDFTRITKYGVIASQTNKIVYMAEYPTSYEDNPHPYYPVNNKASNMTFKKYKAFAKENGITLIGRLGLYRYFNMDQAVQTTMKIINNL